MKALTMRERAHEERGGRLTAAVFGMLQRLESKPQGATFTGIVQPEINATWSLYRTDSGRRAWRAVTIDGRDSWWEERQLETALRVRTMQAV